MQSMAAYDKKSRELEILRKVYPKNDYPEVSHRDKPDFNVTTLEGSKFGVEVTEFYTTGSTARIKNLDTYFSELISEKKFRHKEDIRNFTVDDFKIQDKDGQDKGSARAIFMKAMPLADKMKILNAIIADKISKFDQYDENLPYIELLIHDADGLFGLAKPQEIGSILMHYVPPKLVESNKFSDVLLIFNTDKHEYIASVLDNVLMGTLASVVGFIKNYGSTIDKLLPPDVVPVDFVGSVFRHRGFEKVRPIDFQINGKKRAGIEINGTVICADEDGNTLYHGPQRLLGLPKRTETLPSHLSPKVSKMYDDFMQKNAWAETMFRQNKMILPFTQD